MHYLRSASRIQKHYPRVLKCMRLIAFAHINPRREQGRVQRRQSARLAGRAGSINDSLERKTKLRIKVLRSPSRLRGQFNYRCASVPELVFFLATRYCFLGRHCYLYLSRPQNVEDECGGAATHCCITRLY